ncbi:MAG TPA: type II secretion system protein GspE, partial [Thermodesulfobacteriota bacterium]|nr:type II secretion system protein GspE [Thermodesulfobacteriota bacterium]
MFKSKRIGELLLREKMITQGQLDEVLSEQKRLGEREKLGTLLEQKGYIGQEDLIQFLAKQFGLPIVDLRLIEVSQAVLDLIPANVARKYEIIPIAKEGSTLKVAISDPSNIFALDDLKFLTGSNIQLFLSDEKGLKEALDRLYSLKTTITEVLEDIKGLEVDYIQQEEDLDETSLENAAKE